VKRKVCIWCLVAVLCFSSVAYSVTFPDLSQYSTGDLQTIQSAISKELLERTTGDVSDMSSGSLGLYNVSILDGEVRRDANGKDCLIITFEWSHTDKESRSFWGAFMYRAYQDGIEIEQSFSVRDLEYDTKDKMIKAGAVLKTQIAYILSNSSSPVEVEVYESMAWNNDNTLSKTFTLH
jgi:hypothetical protein